MHYEACDVVRQLNKGIDVSTLNLSY